MLLLVLIRFICIQWQFWLLGWLVGWLVGCLGCLERVGSPFSFLVAADLHGRILCSSLPFTRSFSCPVCVSVSSVRAEIPCTIFNTTKDEHEQTWKYTIHDTEKQMEIKCKRDGERVREWPATVPQTKPNERKQRKKQRTKWHTANSEICLWALNVALVVCLFSLAAWFCILYSINYSVLALLCWFSVMVFFSFSRSPIPFACVRSLSLSRYLVMAAFVIWKHFCCAVHIRTHRQSNGNEQQHQQKNTATATMRQHEEMDRTTATTIIITKNMTHHKCIRG